MKALPFYRRRWTMPAFLALILATAGLAAEGFRLDNKSTVYEASPQPALELADAVTLEAWVQAEPMGQSGGRILDASKPGSQTGFMLDTWPGNSLRFLNGKGACRFEAQLPRDRWSHVAGVYSASQKIMRLYLNGQEVARLEDGEFPPMSVGAEPLRIGCDPAGGNRFQGRILRAAVYRRALSAEEIRQRGGGGAEPASLSDVVGEWKFSEQPGATLRPVAGTVALRRVVPGLSTRYSGELRGAAAPPEEPLTLWYRQPAGQWVEALAIGNGRLGGMVFGGIDRERVQLNEATLWGGGPYDPNNPEALAALPEARRLLFAGKYKEADRLVNDKMIAKPRGQMPYQTMGDLLLAFPELPAVSDYRRDLNLDTAIARVSFTADGVTYTRETFASPVAGVIVLRLTASQPGKIAFTAGLSTPQKAGVTIAAPDTLVLSGVNGKADGIAGALKFQARVQVRTEGGQIAPEEDRLAVRGANAATLFIAAATSYRSFKDVSGDPEALARQALAAASRKSFDRLRREHVAEHQRLFRRVTLDLGSTAAARRPTNERLQTFGQGDDPQLATLYFQFGRYLLISCSRPGSQPATLQGLWNDSLFPPWGSKYTININTEMNYWPVETANLSECVEPLMGMVQELTETGAKTARLHWGAGGWVAHHNTDLWRAAAPIDGPWGHWPTGGAWLCQNLWEHYLFTGDRAFLARLYPALKGAAQFFLDSLVEEPKNRWLVTAPSASPENGHKFGTSLCAGPTMDSQIVRDLFDNCLRAGEILDRDAAFRQQLTAARARLAPNQIGKAGQLQEWLEDWDMEAPEIHHRHVSHLYGFFPSAQISLRGTPELAAAVRKSLEIRGDDATGWGLGWRLNLWARLQDAEHTYTILRLLLRPDRTYPNLFDAHPPFQIDGNFGGTAGIIEMLLQSHAGEIELLPALPQAWPSGSVRGLRARNGFEVSLEWREGKLAGAELRSLLGRPCQIRLGNQVVRLETRPGKTYRFDGALKPR